MTCARREAGARKSGFLRQSLSRACRGAPRPGLSLAPGRRRARLFGLPALALLLAAFGTLAGAPAQAQTTVWSATLTVGHTIIPLRLNPGNFRLHRPAYGLLSVDDLLCRRTQLTDDEFTFGGVTYSRSGVLSLPNKRRPATHRELRHLPFDQAIPDSLYNSPLELVVGGQKLPLADASRYFYQFQQRRLFVAGSYAAGHLGWTVGQQVRVSLEYPTPSPGVQKRDRMLRVLWKGSRAATGYDVHYTASATVAGNAAAGSDAATGWVDAGYTGSGRGHRADGLRVKEISGLTNGQNYRVRARARYAGGHRHPLGVQLGHARGAGAGADQAHPQFRPADGADVPRRGARPADQAGRQR